MGFLRESWCFYVCVTSAMVLMLLCKDILQGPVNAITVGYSYPAVPKPRWKPRNESQVYVCFTLVGRLGNALFQYASILGIARTNNMTLVLKDDSVLSKVLKLPPREDPNFDQKCRGARRVGQRKCCAFDERLIHLKHDDFYNLQQGCLISWVYFENIKQELLPLLQFSDEVMTQARQMVADIRERSNKTLVGMHIRRGDHTGFIAYWNGHKPVTAEYITKAMTYFRTKFDPVHFVVASEDTDWCKDNVAKPGYNVTILEGNSAATDMAVLTLTDHMIISVGTYGWWAGYLNPGVKTYMKDFTVPGSSFANVFNNENATQYFYPGWVPL